MTPVDASATRRSSRSEVIKILETGQLGTLRGIEEEREIEFKGGGRPYDLSSRRGKRDLVADVASMANAGGGVIVLGVRTKKDATRLVEYADDVQRVDPTDYSDARVREVLRSHCYPPPSDVSVNAYSGSDEVGDVVHLVAIEVGSEPEESGPVVVDRLVDDEDRNVGNAVGWPRRYGDNTVWEDGSRIQELIRQGRRRRQDGQTASASTASALRTDFEILERQEGWDEWAVIALQVSPVESLRSIDDFYGTFLERANAWSPVRARGFGFNPGAQPLEPVESRLASLGGRAQYLVHPSGLFTAAALGSPSFLGWAKSPDQDASELSSMVVNPYPLVEFVSEALRFFHGIVWRALDQPAAQIRVVGRGLRDRVPLSIQLHPGIHHFDAPRPCIANSVDERLPVSHAGTPTPSQAFRSCSVAGSAWVRTTSRLLTKRSSISS